MNTETKYILEQLTEDFVNVVSITSITIGNKLYELERSRICYGNSPKGRQWVTEQLPEHYAEVILDMWGAEPTIEDPTPPTIEE